MTAAVHDLFPDAETPDTVTSFELQHAAGMTYRQLDHWCRTGLLHPLTRHREGPGNPRTFPRAELAVAVLMAKFVDAGIAPQIASSYARDLLNTGTTRIAGITIHLPEEH